MPPTQTHKPYYLGMGCALLAFLVVCWVRTYAVHSSVTFHVAVGLAALFPLLRQPKSQSREWLYQQGFTKAIIGLWIGGGVVSAVAYLTVIHPVVGGVDWFYYLCYSRDAIGAYSPSNNMYSYFPGVYWFWTTAMQLVGSDISSLQCVFVVALAVNGLLVGIIVWQHTRCKRVATLAGIWTLMLLSRFDGVQGESEIIANIFFLTCLIAWKGVSLNQWSRWKSLLLFGLGLGLAVYMKQQAGLLALGALWFLGEQRQRTHRWDMLLTLPAFAGLALILCVLTAGRGLDPLWLGLSTATAYPSQDSWWLNLYTQFRHDESFWIVAVISVGLFLYGLCKKNPDPTSNSTRLIGFLMLSGLATLIQFKARPYHHYLLLTIPAVTIGSTILWHQQRDRLTNRSLQRCFLILMAMLPFCWAEDYRWGYHPTQWPSAKQVQPLSSWHQRHDVRDYLDHLSDNLPASTTLLVLPGRHNSLHYLLNTRSGSDQGYSFNETAYQSDKTWQTLITQANSEFVLLLHPVVLDETDREIWNSDRIQQAQRLLENHGYIRVTPADRALLFQRDKSFESPPPDAS